MERERLASRHTRTQKHVNNKIIKNYYNLLKNRLLTKLAAWLRSCLPKNFGKIMKIKQTTRQRLCW